MAVQRNIDVSIEGVLPVDGYKAAISRIQEFERLIEEGRESEVPVVDSVALDEPVRIVTTGTSPQQVYVFDITDLNPTTGLYAFTLVSIGL